MGKQSLFYNNVLNVSCNLLGTALQVKNTVAVWVQDGWKCAGFQPRDRGADRELQPLPSITREDRTPSH